MVFGNDDGLIVGIGLHKHTLTSQPSVTIGGNRRGRFLRVVGFGGNTAGEAIRIRSSVRVG